MVQCVGLCAGARGCVLCVLEVPDFVHCVLLYMPEVVESEIYFLEALEVPEVPEVMRFVLLCMLEAVEDELCLLEELEEIALYASLYAGSC